MKYLILILLVLFFPSTSHAEDNKKEVVQALCATEWGQCGYTNIRQCGEFYIAIPACPDALSARFDAQGKKVAECGAMLKPSETESPLCKITCTPTKDNLCHDTMVDCSKLPVTDKQLPAIDKQNCEKINQLRKTNFVNSLLPY